VPNAKALPVLQQPTISARTSDDSRSVVLAQWSRELVFAVVGHVGSGTSEIATQLKLGLEGEGIDGVPFNVEILKAREVIEKTDREGRLNGLKSDTLERSKVLQDLGDEMRSHGDHAAVARGLVDRIRATRASKVSVELVKGDPVMPDGKPRAYILDSIRHPTEVALLRRIYDHAFTLVGVVCEPEVRQKRLTKKYRDAGEADAKKFMDRDARDTNDHGQRVSDAFHLADYFVDNTTSRLGADDKTPNKDWILTEDLSRLVKIVLHTEVVRPMDSERAMYAAQGAQASSACLSRQVGACLLDVDGTVVSTGTNEVPRAGGGVYGAHVGHRGHPFRCIVITGVGI